MSSASTAAPPATSSSVNELPTDKTPNGNKVYTNIENRGLSVNGNKWKQPRKRAKTRIARSELMVTTYEQRQAKKKEMQKMKELEKQIKEQEEKERKEEIRKIMQRRQAKQEREMMEQRRLKQAKLGKKSKKNQPLKTKYKKEAMARQFSAFNPKEIAN